MGDLDGDGYDDILVSAYTSDWVGLLPGSGWPAVDVDVPWSAAPVGTARSFGGRMLRVDEDHVAISQSDATSGEQWLFTGPWTGANTTADAAAAFTGTEGDLGTLMATGDGDGDWVDDLLVVQPSYDSGGALWMWSGTSW